MNRLLLMVARNFWKVPWAYAKLWNYAKNTEKYSKEEKYSHIQYIMQRAVKSGNIDLKIYGKENIPKENGFLLYSNHQGLFDIVAIAATCDNPLGAVLKKELNEIPFLKHIVDCTNSYPMDREDIRQSLEVIQAVTTEVKKGNKMLEFHGGSFKCAIKSKCPIVPIALINSFKVFDQKGSKPVDMQIHYLKPIYAEEYQKMNTKQLAELVRSRIEKIVNAYA